MATAAIRASTSHLRRGLACSSGSCRLFLRGRELPHEAGFLAGGRILAQRALAGCLVDGGVELRLRRKSCRRLGRCDPLLEVRQRGAQSPFVASVPRPAPQALPVGFQGRCMICHPVHLHEIVEAMGCRRLLRDPKCYREPGEVSKTTFDLTWLGRAAYHSTRCWIQV